MASQKRGVSAGTVNAARIDMKSSKTVAIAALGIALVCIATRVFQFPIPLGYAHLGNCMILIFSVFFGPVIGAIAGGFGSALADLLSYPEWALATLIIKSIMGAIPALIAGKEGLRGNFKSPRVFLGAAAAIVDPLRLRRDRCDTDSGTFNGRCHRHRALLRARLRHQADRHPETAQIKTRTTRKQLSLGTNSWFQVSSLKKSNDIIS